MRGGGLATNGRLHLGKNGRHPFSPLDVPEIIAWFSPRYEITNASGAASAWDTIKPLDAFTAAQASAGNRPAIANGINGHPSLTFTSASSHCLRNTTANLIAAGTTRYVLAVVKCSNSTGGSILTFRAGTRYWGLLSQSIAGSRFYFTDGVAINAGETDASAPDFTAACIIEWELTVGALAVVRVNGVARPVAGSNIVAEDGATGFDIGVRVNSGFFPGDIGDIVIASGIPSTAHKAKLRRYYSVINGGIGGL